MNRMVHRLLFAVVGAAAITVAMLLGMSEFAEIFERRNPMQYFQITDVLMRPDDAKPERIPRAGTQPERGPAEYERPDVELGVERPSVELENRTDTPAARPELDEPARED